MEKKAKMEAQRLRTIKVIEDLMQSHDELMAGVGAIVVDYTLLNECRIEGDKLLGELRNG